MKDKEHNWPLIIGIIIFILTVLFVILFGAYLIFHVGDTVTNNLPTQPGQYQSDSQGRTLARAEDLTGNGTAGAGAGGTAGNYYSNYNGYQQNYPAGDPRNTTGPDPRTQDFSLRSGQ